MPNIQITEKGCRGCGICVDLCPVDVFEFDNSKESAKVTAPFDCIGCLSCKYACPSQCIVVSEVELIRPFHRREENVTLVEQFLQVQPMTQSLTEEEIAAAYNEIGILLSAFSVVIGEILGRGHKTVGRRAGSVAAAHLPEMYENSGLEGFFEGMRGRFGSGFDFDCRYDDDGALYMSIHPCGLLAAVRATGADPGESPLCLLFHEYWAGLISSFAGQPHSYELQKAGDECVLKLVPTQGQR